MKSQGGTVTTGDENETSLVVEHPERAIATAKIEMMNLDFTRRGHCLVPSAPLNNGAFRHALDPAGSSCTTASGTLGS